MTIDVMTDLISAHLAHITAAGYSRQTIEDRGEVLRRLSRDLPFGLESASVDELADWLARPGWSAQTRATYYGHIRGFFTWACNPHRPILDWDPSAALSRPRVQPGTPRPVSTTELAFALERLAKPWRLYVLLAAYAGLRCFEIGTLKREDVTQDRITIRGKGGRLATVPTHPLIWRSVRDLPLGPIARTATGGAPTAKWLSWQTSRQLTEIGLRDATLHRFRHWLGTESLRAPGGNLRKTQELLRHRSIASTAIYTQVTDEERRAAIHALPIATSAL